jgi:3-oxoadipate enol-lactonase
MERRMKHIEVNGARIAYSDAGPTDGEAVLLSHSLFFDHTMFDPLGALLNAAGFRTIAYDHRGQGASSPGTLDELSMDALAEDAAAVIHALDLGPVHVVGNSMGGFVALRLAVRHPELVRTAAALGSSAEEEYKRDEFAPLVEGLGGPGGAAASVETLLYIMFGDTALANGGPVLDHWRASMSDLGPSIRDAAYQVIHRTRILEELKGVAVPVLAIAGDEDHVYPQPISGINIADASGGTETTIAAAGHSVALEQPAAVAEALIKHFG